MLTGLPPPPKEKKGKGGKGAGKPAKRAIAIELACGASSAARARGASSLASDDGATAESSRKDPLFSVGGSGASGGRGLNWAGEKLVLHPVKRRAR